MKTPITYWGGKQSLVASIIPIIPPHTTYCEPFFGGGAIFFAKDKSQVEIINDINREVVNFYTQTSVNFEALQALVHGTLHSRSKYRDAVVIYENPHLFTELQRAWAFYTATNQGYSGQIGSWGFGTIDNSVEKKVLNSKGRFDTALRERLDLVQIECVDAISLVKLRDRPTTFFYLDPPYFNSDMGHYGGYTRHDFERLLEACSGIQGKFLLSSYPSDLLTKYAEAFGWYQKSIPQKTRASKARKEKMEVLTSNYPI